MKRFLRRALFALALLSLGFLSWTGITGGLDQLDESHAPGEIAQTASQLAYGIFALLGVVTAFWGRRFAPLILSGWAVSVTLAAGLASVVWGETSILIGLLAAAGAMLIALLVIWLLRWGRQ